MGVNPTGKLKGRRVTQQKFTVYDRLGSPISLHGEIIADVRHDNKVKDEPPWLRWTDMVLYKIDEQHVRDRYAVHIIGRSVVYHGADTNCRQRPKSPWLRTTVEELYKADVSRYDELIACRERGCAPRNLDDLEGEEVIQVETNDHNLILAPTPKAIIQRLYKDYGQITMLAAKLLKEAALKDPGIHRAINMPRRVGS
jgi:hypothetical protein